MPWGPEDPGERLPRTFYLRPAAEVARDLPGRLLRLGPVTLRITETEAYGGPGDSASHARAGRTPRNAPMWEEGGRAYMYLCYGLHAMLNLVTGPAGRAEAVLIRSCEVAEGLATVQARRGAARGPALLTGPGRVTQALGVDLTFTGHLLFEPGGLELLAGSQPAGLLHGPRVGIDFASPEDRERPWRFAAAGTPWVSRLRGLLPEEGPPRV